MPEDTNYSIRRRLIAVATAILVSAPGSHLSLAQASEAEPAGASGGRPTTMKGVMTEIVAPQSDILWRAEEPASDEEWSRLEEAAIALQVASSMMTMTSTNPEDHPYQRMPIWRLLTDEMRTASIRALASIRDKDLDALFIAGNDLYTPCEACHRATYQKE